MKSPRTLLNELEEAGCRLAGIVGTRSGGTLLLSENENENLALASKLRAFDCPIAEIKEALNNVAGRIERRAHPGVIKLDRDGYFRDSMGHLIRTEESVIAAKEYYNKK